MKKTNIFYYDNTKDSVVILKMSICMVCNNAPVQGLCGHCLERGYCGEKCQFADVEHLELMPEQYNTSIKQCDDETLRHGIAKCIQNAHEHYTDMTDTPLSRELNVQKIQQLSDSIDLMEQLGLEMQLSSPISIEVRNRAIDTIRVNGWFRDWLSRREERKNERNRKKNEKSKALRSSGKNRAKRRQDALNRGWNG